MNAAEDIAPRLVRYPPADIPNWTNLLAARPHSAGLWLMPLVAHRHETP